MPFIPSLPSSPELRSKSQHCTSHHWSNAGFKVWSRASQPAAMQVDVASLKSETLVLASVPVVSGSHSCSQLTCCAIWRCMAHSAGRQVGVAPWPYLHWHLMIHMFNVAYNSCCGWREQEGGLGEAHETREGATWALSLALSWGMQAQDAMDVVLLPGMGAPRMTQHPEGAQHLSRDT